MCREYINDKNQQIDALMQETVSHKIEILQEKQKTKYILFF